MKKFIAAVALLVTTGITFPAMAQVSSSSSSSSSSVAVSADLVCLSAAVDVRENAIISARSKFNAAIIVALQTRRDAFKAALTITDNHDRQTAIVAVWKAYRDASIKARAQYKADVKAAWKVYATARTACHVDDLGMPNPPKLPKQWDDDKNEHKNNESRENNSAAASAHTRVRGYGLGADLDLSF